ncbi:hypothetical protein GCM10025789_02660 [Tessaracoccus lubricantis]|uniref:Uncharacterized protein n=1 Tax=Tessaracoccus lubricantis TaxID=545543 RepID=A0ABP9F0M9_9ACTN
MPTIASTSPSSETDRVRSNEDTRKKVTDDLRPESQLEQPQVPAQAIPPEYHRGGLNPRPAEGRRRR